MRCAAAEIPQEISLVCWHRLGLVVGLRRFKQTLRRTPGGGSAAAYDGWFGLPGASVRWDKSVRLFLVPNP